ncbi:MAG TPA: hypothetical protein VJR48_01305, partial [Ktedonobacterales bacterium]|nr:hypothetical protein [Ktedonobacterales bacterium]
MAKRSAPSSDMASRASAGAQASAITIVQTTPPPAEAIFGSQARIAERRVAHTQAHAIEQRPPHSAASAPPAQHATVTPPPPTKARASQHPARNTAQTEKHVRPHREKLAPFEMTDEMRATIERRYLELSQPVEFDGIRTRIASELNLPKPVVKQVVRELRAKRQLPSWWEL